MTQNTPEAASPMKGRRTALGLSLRALSTECGKAGGPISNSQLSKVERGVSVPRPAARQAIKKVLGLDPVTGEPELASTGSKP